MWKIWADFLLPQALKSCSKSNKSPNLVTLHWTLFHKTWVDTKISLEYFLLDELEENRNSNLS